MTTLLEAIIAREKANYKLWIAEIKENNGQLSAQLDSNLATLDTFEKELSELESL